jgi:hypothetical protein
MEGRGRQRTEGGGRKRKRKRKRERERERERESKVSGQWSLGKIVKMWHVLWRFRTWGRMPQGRTGTGCPSYEEEIEEAASSSSVFCLEVFCLLTSGQY